MCGTRLTTDEFNIVEGLVSVRQVTNAPGIVHVTRAADLAKADYLGVSRYSHSVAAELAVFGEGPGEGARGDASLFGFAWHAASLLKLRGHAELFCPVASTVSWDTVAAVSDNSVIFTLLDDVPRQIAVAGEPREILLEELEWVREHFQSALHLRGVDVSRRFGLAFNLAYVWNHTSDPRIAIINLWCALEALFSERTDKPLTERLVERIASWLSSAGAPDIRALYNRRCDAVHGRWLNDAEIGEAIGRSAELLAEALTACVERRAVPLPDWA